jgi:hypothetical protein
MGDYPHTLLLGIELCALEFGEQPYRGLYAVAKSKGSLLVLHPFWKICDVSRSEFRTIAANEKKRRKSRVGIGCTPLSIFASDRGLVQCVGVYE